jgi:hypothetical protein
MERESRRQEAGGVGVYSDRRPMSLPEAREFMVAVSPVPITKRQLNILII